MPVMLVMLTLSFLSLSPGAPITNIVEPVQRGDRLDISNFAGEIHVSSADDEMIRIEAEHRRGETILLERNSSVIRVRASSWDESSDTLEIQDDEKAILEMHDGQGVPGVVIYRVSVPAWLAVTVGGATTSVSLQGLEGSTDITLFDGDIIVTGCRGDLTLRTLAGSIRVDETRARVRIRSGQGSIRFQGGSGEITAESTSGDISFESISSARIEAVTVSGGISYSGELAPEGRYSFSTHRGDLDLVLPDSTDASVTVRLVKGSLESEFLPTEPTAAGRRFRIGDGRALLDLESFSGTIRIRRRASSTGRLR